MSLMGILDRVADAAALDKVIDPARRAVQAALPQPVKNLLHGTWLGHPVHPVLVHVPVGTWLSAGLLDLAAAAAARGHGPDRHRGRGGGAASLSGAADWSEQDTGVRRLGALHAALNTGGSGSTSGRSRRVAGAGNRWGWRSRTRGWGWRPDRLPSAGTCRTRSRRVSRMP